MNSLIGFRRVRHGGNLTGKQAGRWLFAPNPGQRAKRFCLFVGIGFGASLLSGCVSTQPEPTSLGFAGNHAESAEPVSTQTIVTSSFIDQTTGQVVTDDAGNAVMAAIPFKAVRNTAPQTQPAAVTDPAPSVPETQSQTSDIPNATAEIAAASALPSDPAAQDVAGSSSTAKASAEVVAAATEPSVPTTETSDIAGVADQQPAAIEPVAAAPITPPKKPNFFQRIFSTNKRTNVASANVTGTNVTGANAFSAPVTTGQAPAVRTQLNSGDRPQVASLFAAPKSKPKAARSASASGGNASALPGVQTQAKLFGLDEPELEEAMGATEVAALGSLGRISPNGLRVQHEKVRVACLKPAVIRILNLVERRYGKKPVITSGYRSPKRNRRAGGARNSQHIYCKAADIQVEGVSKWDLAKFLRSLPGRGGVGTYCRTRSVHFDVGSKRDWHHPCRRSSARKRKKA